nr:hypothetical protein [Tanacetum cinerariifolium]
MTTFFILDKLTEIAGSDRLQDKMKIVFTQIHSEDECFIEIVRDLCCGFRLSLSKNRRLIADLEALGHCADAVRSLGYLREMVGRDYETFRVLEQLLARAENLTMFHILYFDQPKPPESEDECFIEIVRDLCCGFRLSLSKNRRLIADLEALGHCADAVRSLGYLREMVGRDYETFRVLEQLLARAEMVGRDSETLGVLEQLLARAEVGRHLKAGYVDGIDETE